MLTYVCRIIASLAFYVFLLLSAANSTVGNTSPSGLPNALVAAETHNHRHVGMADMA